MSTRIREDNLLRKPDFADVPVDHLAFDVENHRLTMDRVLKTDEAMVTLLWREMAVDEIVDSIAANGFSGKSPSL